MPRGRLLRFSSRVILLRSVVNPSSQPTATVTGRGLRFSHPAAVWSGARRAARKATAISFYTVNGACPRLPRRDRDKGKAVIALRVRQREEKEDKGENSLRSLVRIIDPVPEVSIRNDDKSVRRSFLSGVN